MGPAAASFTRRKLLATAGPLLAVVGIPREALQRSFRQDGQPVRYPDPDVVVLDDRFARYRIGQAPIERLYTGTTWAEGPAWNPVGRYLIWSDIPGNEQLRWTEEDGHVSRQFRYPSDYSNGNTFDLQGRQITCQHGTRRVVRYEYDGTITTLADSYGGISLNAPNDVLVHPGDGSIWFTDPGYGSLLAFEGQRAETGSPQPYQKEAIYRIDAQSGQLRQVADDPVKPNGLAFSPDLSRLYVADTGRSHYPDAASLIWVYAVEDGRLDRPRTFASMEWDGRTGFADGIATDEDGNVWASAGWAGDGYDGVHVFAPDGTRIGQIRLPEVCSNVCFGGSKLNRLFMTASQSLYALYVETRGAHFLGG